MSALIRSTLAVYGEAFSAAVSGLFQNYLLPLIPILYFVLLIGVGRVFVMLLGPVAGGFALGMIEVILVANYFALVAAAVEGERLKLSELWPRTRDLIFPVISILFAIFVLQLMVQLFSFGGNQQILRAAVNLGLFVFGNALPEVCYQRGYNALAAIQESAEFLRENTVEWFLPLLLMCAPMMVVAPEALLRLLASSDPMKFSLMLFEGYSAFATVVAPSYLAAAAVVALYLSFLLMVFRGVLFRRLSSSSRRKRVYDWQQNAGE